MEFEAYKAKLGQQWCLVRNYADEVCLGRPYVAYPFEPQRQALVHELGELLSLLKCSTSVQEKPSWWDLQAAPAIEGVETLLSVCQHCKSCEDFARMAGYSETELAHTGGFIFSLAFMPPEEGAKYSSPIHKSQLRTWLNVSEGTLRNMLKDGRIPYIDNRKFTVRVSLDWLASLNATNA